MIPLKMLKVSRNSLVTLILMVSISAAAISIFYSMITTTREVIGISSEPDRYHNLPPNVIITNKTLQNNNKKSQLSDTSLNNTHSFGLNNSTESNIVKYITIDKEKKKVEFHAKDYLISSINQSATKNNYATSTITTTTLTNFSNFVNQTILSRCFPYNSLQWLENRRLGNYNHPTLTHEFVLKMILYETSQLLNPFGNSQLWLNQTICHEESRFRDITTHTTTPGKYNQTLRDWSLRLIYMAIHIHQHQHAVPEATARRETYQECHEAYEHYNIGPYDYECPQAKFLIISLPRAGLGAIMRLSVVNAFMAGITTNRTILILNNTPVGPRVLRLPWQLASCPREDIQCFYLPPSPCVITIQDLVQAPLMLRGQMRQVFRSGQIPKEIDHFRVLVMELFIRPQREPESFRPSLQNVIHTKILQPMAKQQQRLGQNYSNEILDMLFKASAIVTEDDKDEGKFGYFAYNAMIRHAFLFYGMRPNLHSAQKLNDILSKIIPSNFNHQLALGLPIRGSDKCKAESECLPFHKYMSMASKFWKHHENNTMSSLMDNSYTFKDLNASIIVTTEHKQIQKDQQRFTKRHGNQLQDFTFHFVNNEFDVQQGTGDPEVMTMARVNVSRDDIMLSSVSSLKLQLMATYTVGNCCSNFHLLLFDYLREGCGAASKLDHSIAECMQDNPDKEFRLCCQWSRNEECIAKRENQK